MDYDTRDVDLTERLLERLFEMTGNDKKRIAQDTRWEARFEKIACEVRTLMHELFEQNVRGLLVNDLVGHAVRAVRCRIRAVGRVLAPRSAIDVDETEKTRRGQGKEFFTAIFDVPLAVFEEERGDQRVDRPYEAMGVVRMGVERHDVLGRFQTSQAWQSDGDVDENQTRKDVLLGIVARRGWIGAVGVRIVHGVLLIDQRLAERRVDDRRRARRRDHFVDQQVMLRIVGERGGFVLRIEVLQGDHEERHAFVQHILQRFFDQMLQLQENTDENDALQQQVDMLQLLEVHFHLRGFVEIDAKIVQKVALAVRQFTNFVDLLNASVEYHLA